MNTFALSALLTGLCLTGIWLLFYMLDLIATLPSAVKLAIEQKAHRVGEDPAWTELYRLPGVHAFKLVAFCARLNCEHETRTEARAFLGMCNENFRFHLVRFTPK